MPGIREKKLPGPSFIKIGGLKILEVLDRWYEGGMDPSGVAHNYFKVKTPDGEIFLLRYTPRFQSWTVCRQVPKPHFSDN